MEKAAGRRVYRRRRGQKTELGPRERRRLLQLVACLVLFLAVFFAKGADRLGKLRAELTQALGTDVDFQAVFSQLGLSLASGQPVEKTLNELWVDVFLPQTQEAGPQEGQQAGFLSARRAARSTRLLTGAARGDSASGGGTARESAALPEAEPAVVYVDYTGPTLPDNTTMDRYALGLGETVTPVMGKLTSEFGWREHPIEGGEKFHCGVDLKADTGTDVLAFAAGTVDYIGESDVYGQYLQLRHDNGVTSFYAHCSKLCVQQGQRVAAGEKVAESGATGEVTGPHLHFEMKKDGVRLNPAYYIETLP